MRKCSVGVLAAAVSLFAGDIASATCNSAQITGTWSLVGNFGQGGSMFTFRCPALSIIAGTTNHYRLSGACIWYSAGIGTIAYAAGGQATIVVNPANCNASGSFIFVHQATSETANILLLKFADPGAGTAKQAQGVVEVATNSYSLNFTLMR